MTPTDTCKDLFTSYMTMPANEQVKLLSLFRVWQKVKQWVGSGDFYLTAVGLLAFVTINILTLKQIGL